MKYNHARRAGVPMTRTTLVILALTLTAAAACRHSQARSEAECLCPQAPMSQVECTARFARALGEPAAVDRALDWNSDGVIGGPDTVICHSLPELNLPRNTVQPRDFTCAPQTKEICTARLKAAFGSPSFVDPALDYNGDGIIGAPDTVGCR